MTQFLPAIEYELVSLYWLAKSCTEKNLKVVHSTTPRLEFPWALTYIGVSVTQIDPESVSK